MRILLTNDDGPLSPGLAVMRAALAELGEVTVVCPDAERSAVGHAITCLLPVRAFPVALADGSEALALTGTPVDCVKFALLEALDGLPDLIVSGCNAGLNAGADAFYSGTVAAAIEGAFYGVTSVAVSTARSNGSGMAAVAAQAVRVVRWLLERDLPGARAFNVNIPRLGEREPEIRLTRLSTAFPPGRYQRMRAPFDRTYYWLDSADGAPPPPDGSDVAALAAGHISVTPLRCDLTDLESLQALRAVAAASQPEMDRP